MDNRVPARTPDFSAPNALAWWVSLLQSFSQRWPGSGDLQNTQDIEPSLVRSEGAQLGFINFNTIASKDPQLEERITRDVASYGRQLGWIIEALDVVISGDMKAPTADQQRALTQFAALREAIGEAKQRTVRDRCDQLVADIEELTKDPLANRNELQRLRSALHPAGPAGR